jgi:predicted enzyme related to lactoylglutathione lyase
MTTPRPPSDSHRTHGRLAQSLITLAEMPDDVSTLDDHLLVITQLVVDRVAAVDYASVTALREDAFTTVAASSELALAVDEAQYADQAGPCLEPLHTGEPVGLADISATMRWPGFRDQALGMGLCASLSVPLFAGSGAPVAVLNLYGHDSAAMVPVIDGIWAVFNTDPAAVGTDRTQGLEPGAGELVIGLAEGFAVRATIQEAVGVIMAQRGISALDAYLALRDRAARSGDSLATTASAVLRQAASGGIGWVSSVTIDAVDPETLAEFWSALLGLRVHPRESRFVALERPPAGAPELVFQPVPEPKRDKVRIHLDINVPDVDAAVRRVLKLGGSSVDEIHEAGDTWRVMRDPEGNEFCLIPVR